MGVSSILPTILVPLPTKPPYDQGFMFYQNNWQEDQLKKPSGKLKTKSCTQARQGREEACQAITTCGNRRSPTTYAKT